MPVWKLVFMPMSALETGFHAGVGRNADWEIIFKNPPQDEVSTAYFWHGVQRRLSTQTKAGPDIKEWHDIHENQVRLAINTF